MAVNSESRKGTEMDEIETFLPESLDPTYEPYATDREGYCGTCEAAECACHGCFAPLDEWGKCSARCTVPAPWEVGDAASLAYAVWANVRQNLATIDFDERDARERALRYLTTATHGLTVCYRAFGGAQEVK